MARERFSGGSLVTTGGEGDLAQLVEREGLRAGDFAGALQRRANGDVDHGLGDVGSGHGLDAVLNGLTGIVIRLN
ncbi:hypothetical protein ACWDKQ_31320 [Saccharopolyspora sp. NPDC000995]